MIGMMEFQIRLIVSILVPSTVNYLLKKKKKSILRCFSIFQLSQIDVMPLQLKVSSFFFNRETILKTLLLGKRGW